MSDNRNQNQIFLNHVKGILGSTDMEVIATALCDMATQYQKLSEETYDCGRDKECEITEGVVKKIEVLIRIFSE